MLPQRTVILRPKSQTFLVIAYGPPATVCASLPLAQYVIGGGGRKMSGLNHSFNRYVWSPRACQALSWVMTQR